eukprot:gb/GECH01012218.1/.p1 GENE.gb/GECH01012218.1/~~gb/GECH01012218.1/.p1  ORF type:complete len:344 (+),score=106.10 gb/GECH01012218.1/:1-1032(+)
MSVQFQDKDAIIDAINRVKSDKYDEEWCVAGYVGSNTVGLIEKGQGKVEDMREHFNEEGVFYGLVRMEEQIDDSKTIKFGFVLLVGPRVKPLQRGRIMMHKGTVTPLFDPYHVSLETSNLDEITTENIRKMVANASMSASHVLSASESEAKAPAKPHRSSSVAKSPAKPTSTTPSATNGSAAGSKAKWEPPTSSSSSGVDFPDKDSVVDAIKDVRNDETETDWCLLQFTGKKSVEFVTKGSGGADEMKEHLKDDGVFYGLVRVTEQIDDSITVKFAYVNFVGNSVRPMMRGRANTHHGAIQDMIRSIQVYHVDFVISDRDEISQSIVMEKVGNASMARSRVLE